KLYACLQHKNSKKFVILHTYFKHAKLSLKALRIKCRRFGSVIARLRPKSWQSIMRNLAFKDSIAKFNLY
ncbi:MAG: hypothetical protein K2G68_07165, partial [Helicobacter sp.]|nr:hypothetical protein [Helicobacter sp.]